jgi:hypothetical protein
MADVKFTIDREKVWRLACKSDGTYQLVRSAGDATAGKANALSAGFKTGRYHPNHKSPGVGGTQPSYRSNTRRNPTVPTAIVYTANYAAQKDNMQHNTLLKSL